MEATGRDGGGGPSWSYRCHEETETGSSSYTISSSSRSGTIVSTACTSDGSRHSTFSAEAALLQLELQNDEKDAEFVQPIKKLRIETKEMLEVDKKMKHMQSLVQEFFREPSENRSIRGGDDMGAFAVERWLKELGVGWVLCLADYPRILDDYDIRIWTLALTEIMETIRDTTSFFPYHGDGPVGVLGISEEVEEISTETGKGKHPTRLDPLQFALFVQETISKMLVFIDVMFSKPLRPIHRPPHTPLSLLSHISLHGALSKALSGFRLQFHLTPSEEVEKIETEMLSLLSAKQDKAVEAIWSTLEMEKETRTRALKTMEEYSSGTETPQGSSNIHEATYLEMEHINFLLRNNCTLVSEAASSTSISLITGMVSCLKEELITKSKLFRDKGLMFLFLLNNSNFIWEKLKYCCVKVDLAAVTREEHYIRSYIEVSWAPMLASLSNHAPLCLGRNHSPLSKFESEFQKTYTTQKLWKVPDPGLRKKLRKTVIEKIIPDYTRYIEDSKVTNPKFAPKEMEEMLQELFEG